MDSELFYNTPTFPKDTEYTECEKCEGDGWVYTCEIYGDDDDKLKQMDCPVCFGEGQLPIE